MPERLEPFGDRIVVKPEGGEQKLPSGLHIPDVAQETPQRGEVLALGHHAEVASLQPDATGPDVGDLVLFSKYAGLRTEIAGEEVIVLRLGDVLGKIEAT